MQKKRTKTGMGKKSMFEHQKHKFITFGSSMEHHLQELHQ